SIGNGVAAVIVIGRTPSKHGTEWSNCDLRSIGRLGWVVLFQELDGVAITQVGRDWGEMAGILGDLKAERLQHQRLAGHVELQARKLPVVSAKALMLKSLSFQI